MSNDPRDLDGVRLRRALHALGRDPQLRRQLMGWLVQAESRFPKTTPVRDEVTGPIIDALHDDHDQYEKSLSDGTKFEFLYRTKIARDFLLSNPQVPNHVWEPQTTRLLCHLASQMTRDVLIGGAYFGDQAVLLGRELQNAGSGGRVHCFEPNDDQRHMLQRNAEINGLSNLRIHNSGLWNESSQTLRFDGFDSFANAVLAAEGEAGFPTISVDDYLKDVDRKVGLVMLDIEGAEYQALIGARRTLQADTPSVIFEVHRDYVDWRNGLEATPICQLLLGLGYRLFAIRDFNTNQAMEGLPIELVPAATVYLAGPAHGFNMLAAPPSLVLDPPFFKIVDGVSPKLLAHKDPLLHHPTDGMPGR